MTAKRRAMDYDDTGADRTVADPATDTRQFVTFTLGEAQYCVDILAVREIRAWSGITSIPNSPKHVIGVINLRGTIVPVVDLRQRFGGDAAEVTPASVIIIVRVEGATTGLLVDGVSDIIKADKSRMSLLPELDGEARNPLFSGLITEGETLLAVVNLAQVIARDLAPAVPAMSQTEAQHEAVQ